MNYGRSAYWPLIVREQRKRWAEAPIRRRALMGLTL